MSNERHSHYACAVGPIRVTVLKNERNTIAGCLLYVEDLFPKDEDIRTKRGWVARRWAGLICVDNSLTAICEGGGCTGCKVYAVIIRPDHLWLEGLKCSLFCLGPVFFTVPCVWIPSLYRGGEMKTNFDDEDDGDDLKCCQEFETSSMSSRSLACELRQRCRSFSLDLKARIFLAPFWVGVNESSYGHKIAKFGVK